MERKEEFIMDINRSCIFTSFNLAANSGIPVEVCVFNNLGDKVEAILQIRSENWVLKDKAKTNTEKVHLEIKYKSGDPIIQFSLLIDYPNCSDLSRNLSFDNGQVIAIPIKVKVFDSLFEGCGIARACVDLTDGMVKLALRRIENVEAIKLIFAFILDNAQSINPSVDRSDWSLRNFGRNGFSIESANKCLNLPEFKSRFAAKVYFSS